MKLHHQVYTAEYPGQREVFHQTITWTGQPRHREATPASGIREPTHLLITDEHWALHGWITENIGWGSLRKGLPNAFEEEYEVELTLDTLFRLELAINLDQLPPTKDTVCWLFGDRPAADYTYRDHHEYQKAEDLRLVTRARKIIQEEGLRIFYCYRWLTE